jgi:glycosyltransferase involved in cell wall biosynthesis
VTEEDLSKQEGMLLVLPVPFRVLDGRVFVEAQAANGLDRWAENFSRIIVAAPTVPENLIPKLSGFVWREFDSLEHCDRIVCRPLPSIYKPIAFLRSVPRIRRILAASINQSKHLQFAPSGLFGDWAAVAAMEAIRLHRRYAIHKDIVDHELAKAIAGQKLSLRRIRAAVESPVMKAYHRHIIRHSSLGLWHGSDCYRAFSPWCRESHLIHDIHTKKSDLIDAAGLEQKQAAIRTAETLQICYVGRLDPMKAPLDWLRSIDAARNMGARVKATWYGEGKLLSDAKLERTRLNLEEIVDYPGFISNRHELLNHLRSAHALVFTHITQESPRNLLEALISGTPILGYHSSYAADLINSDGGGLLVPLGDFRSLGKLVAGLSKDRDKLVELSRQAALNGRRFNDSAVFAERSRLIQQHA